MRLYMSARESGPGAGCRPKKEVTGRMVLICLVAFFAVVAGVNAIMIRAAVSTFSGIETENAYQAGLSFEREMVAAEAQEALHWRVSAKVSEVAGATLVEVIAADAAGRPLAGLQAAGHLVHPTDRRSDHKVPLGEDAVGTFHGRTDAVVGQWSLVIELSRDGTRLFRSRNRVFLR
jgi:nitrogen fixation protein FixH